MMFEFQDWSDGYATHARKIASSMSTLCTSVRELRTAAVRKSREPKLSGSEQIIEDRLNELSDLLVNSVSEVHEPALATANEHGMGGAAEEIAAILNCVKALQERPFHQQSADVASQKASGSALKRPSGVALGLMQKGAKHFSKLAEVFQLQDRFEQRNEHIEAGLALALGADPSSQPAMFQIVNGQIEGVAVMTADFSELAEAAIENLISMDQADHEKHVAAVQQQADALKLIHDSAVGPLSEIEALCRAVASAFLSVQEDPAAYGSTFANDAVSDGSQRLAEFADSLENWRKSLVPESNSSQIDDKAMSLTELLGQVKNSSEMLTKVASDLLDLVTKQSTPVDSVDADLAGFLDEISGSFTMDSERSDHQAVMHRLGLS